MPFPRSLGIRFARALVNVRGDSSRLEDRQEAGLLPALQEPLRGSKAARAVCAGAGQIRGMLQEPFLEIGEPSRCPASGRRRDAIRTTRGGEFSIGDLGRFKSALTRVPS